MNGQNRGDIKIGSEVDIRLESGETGRVQKIL